MKEKEELKGVKIFISHSHSEKMNEYAKEIEESLRSDLKKLWCERLNLEHKGEIYDLIKQDKEIKYFIFLMNDSFFKSNECMFALNELSRAKDYRNYCFPIIIKDADLFNNDRRDFYIKYWNKEIDNLNKKIESNQNLENKILYEINKCSTNKITLKNLFGFLKDVNTLKEVDEEKFNEVVELLKMSLKTKIEIDSEALKSEKHEK